MKAIFVGLFLLTDFFLFSNFQNRPIYNDSDFKGQWHSAYLKCIDKLLTSALLKKDKISLYLLKNLKQHEEEWKDSTSFRSTFIKEVILSNKQFAK